MKLDVNSAQAISTGNKKMISKLETSSVEHEVRNSAVEHTFMPKIIEVIASMNTSSSASFPLP